MSAVRRFLKATKTLARTREAVGSPVTDSDALEDRFINGALAIAQDELAEAKKQLLEFILEQGFPAQEVKQEAMTKSPAERARQTTSWDEWLQEQANERDRELFVRLADGKELRKRPDGRRRRRAK